MHQDAKVNQDAKVSGSKDVIGFLKGQHEQIKGLFEKVIGAKGEARASAFTELSTLMSAHEAAEEAVVHPAARTAIAGGEAEVAAREKEEDEAKRTIAALKKLDVSSSEFDTKIRTLQAAVLKHAKSEEKEEFDKLANTIDPARLQTMRQQAEKVESTNRGR